MKIISFSLYSNGPRYQVGAIQNAAIALNLFPDWTLYFYCDDYNLKNNLNLKAMPNVRMFRRVSQGGCHGMFWRFEAASDPQATHIIFRDCDSRLSEREKGMVDDWVKDGADFHVIYDHPSHRSFPIGGGLWGVKGGVIKDMPRLINDWGKWDKPRMQDQEFLKHVVVPIISRNNVYIHQPETDQPTRFVGQQWNERNEPI